MGKVRSAAVAVVLLGGIMTMVGCTKSATRISIKDGPVGQGNGITPDAVAVDRNSDVVLSVTNTGTKTHGFSVQGYDVVTEIPAGQTETVRFTATRSGTFKLFCQLHPSHAPAELTIN